MSLANETSNMHKQAAVDHHEAAKKHLLAAECIEKHNSLDPEEATKDAMNSCNVAQKSSAWACKSGII